MTMPDVTAKTYANPASFIGKPFGTFGDRSHELLTVFQYENGTDKISNSYNDGHSIDTSLSWYSGKSRMIMDTSIIPQRKDDNSGVAVMTISQSGSEDKIEFKAEDPSCRKKTMRDIYNMPVTEIKCKEFYIVDKNNNKIVDEDEITFYDNGNKEKKLNLES